MRGRVAHPFWLDAGWREEGRLLQCPVFSQRLQLAFGRQVPLSDAAIVCLQKWGAGGFGQLEAVFRGFQFTLQRARWINHVRLLPWEDIEHDAAAEEKEPLT
jgi:hypothetical protein